MTVESGSLSRAPRNDIRKGTRAIWLIAVSALCEVSLQHVRQPQNNLQIQGAHVREAPQDRDDIICELVDEFLCVLGRGFGGLEVLCERTRDLRA